MDDAEIVKSKVDIVEVISSYVPLKKAGRNFTGLCPFHTEKTPSFMVSAERQSFKCFGCGESGDVFTFLEKLESWDFRETLQELAKRTGVKLKEFAPTEKTKTRDKLVEVNKMVARFWQHLLLNHKAGEAARKYLDGRGIAREMWEKFGLGFAPDGWDNSLKFLTKRGFSLADCASAGIILSRGGRSNSFYDRFRSRLMFPIADARGQIMGFSARVIGQEQKTEPKYINTPQTEIFSKGSLLFGLNVAKDEIRKKNEAVLVEGEFDVIAASQAGVGNVVASKGTALTEMQVGLLARLCENVALCFDSDLAGDAASRRGIELMDERGLNVKVVKLGKFKDPDEFVRADATGFKKAILAAHNIYDYFIESATARFDATTAVGKKKIGQELIGLIAKITDDLVRAHYIAKLARVLDLEVNLVAEAVTKKVMPAENVSAIPEVLKAEKVDSEHYFLSIVLARDSIDSKVLAMVEGADFENNNARALWKWLHDIIPVHKSKSLKQLFKKLPVELSEFVDSLYFINISLDFTDGGGLDIEIEKSASRVRVDSIRRKLKVISFKIQVAQSKNDDSETERLTGQFKQLSGLVKQLTDESQN